MNYQAKKKWNGVHTVIGKNFKTMDEANDFINSEIANGNQPQAESEDREYYIIPK